MAKILCIEDDADIQHFIGQILFKEGYEIHYAWNGKEGYDKVLELDPDLLLVDLMLPLMNGVELIKKLREHKATKPIPTIVVTSFGDQANMLKYAMEALGAEAFLRKPIQIDEMISLIKQTLLKYPRAPRGVPIADVKELRKGCVRADPKFQTVWVDDRLVATLAQKEFALLRCLITLSGSAPKSSLLKSLGYGANQGDALKQIAHRLRSAFGPAEKHRIRTTPEGYELIG